MGEGVSVHQEADHRGISALMTASNYSEPQLSSLDTCPSVKVTNTETIRNTAKEEGGGSEKRRNISIITGIRLHVFNPAMSA